MGHPGNSSDEKTPSELRGIGEGSSLDLTGVEKHTSFVLLKKKSLFGYVYFFEKRKKTDSFGGKLALFGGSRHPNNPESSHEAILDNELAEELGLSGNREAYVSKFYLLAKRENGQDTAIEVFTLEEKVSRKLRSGRLKRAQKKRSLEAPNDPVGEVVKVRRVWLHWWWLWRWHIFTPVAAYAVLADWNHDVMLRKRFRKP